MTRPPLRLAATFSVSLVCIAATSARQGTASISGTTVTSDMVPQPVRRAVVRLMGTGITTNVSTVSDDQGRFSFSGLEAGTYRVTASKPAYLAAEYGARRPGGLGTPIAIRTGERRTDVQVELVRGAVVSGVVRDGRGEPAPNVPITVTPASRSSGTSGYVSASDGVLTDDRGVYRVYGLAPGEYLIAATPRVGSGEVRRPTAANLDASLRAIQPGAVSGALATTATAPPARRFLPAPVYYPGTPIPQEAARVKLIDGEVNEGLNFTVDVVPAVSVEGTVVTLDGSPPPPVSLTLAQIGPPVPVFSSLMFAARQDSPDRFAYGAVTPGQYVLTARESSGRGVSGGGRGAAPPPARGGPATNLSRWAVAELTVAHGDVTGVTLTLRPPLTLTGRIVFDAAATTTPPEAGAVTVSLASLPDMPASIAPFGGSAPRPMTASANGAFTFESVLPGAFALSASAAGGWMMKSAVRDGRDLLDEPLIISAASGNVPNVVVTLTDRLATLQGTLQTAGGQPATDYVVVLFSAERAHWFAGSRRIRRARPSTDGTYSVADLPSGTYYLAALTDVVADDLTQPPFFEQLLPASLKIVIADRADVQQDLRIKLP